MTQQITTEDVRSIADLARLGLTENEVEKATQNLQGILDNFSKIQSIDTANVPMATDASGLTNVTREDVAADGLICPAADLLANAPQVQDGQVKVKAVFK